MAYQKQDRKFVNSIFLTKTWGEGDSILISTGINRDEFIKELKALPANEKGFVNLTIGTQKNDSNKFSMWLNEGRQSSSSSSASSSKPTPAPQLKQTVEPSSTDDLPF
jgi:hypothetical protein